MCVSFGQFINPDFNPRSYSPGIHENFLKPDHFQINKGEKKSCSDLEMADLIHILHQGIEFRICDHNL